MYTDKSHKIGSKRWHTIKKIKFVSTRKSKLSKIEETRKHNM